MSDLLLHLGYPKAASTTLQNGLFYELHRRGQINFIGRAFESGYFGPAQNKAAYKAWFRSVCGEQNLPAPAQVSAHLSPDKLNVLSEGLFINESHNTHLPIPQNIANYFRERAARMSLLFVLRSQQTLIMSNYVQRFRKIKEKTFAHYLETQMRTPEKTMFDIFYFHEMISRYAAVFGRENVHLALFEDLLHDKAAFSRDLAVALGKPPALIAELLRSAHLNKTPKTDTASVIRKPGRLSLWAKLMPVRGNGPSTVPEITADEKEFIFQHFREENVALMKEFKLDATRMQKYGYI
jgi:hypothetical protein